MQMMMMKIFMGWIQCLRSRTPWDWIGRMPRERENEKESINMQGLPLIRGKNQKNLIHGYSWLSVAIRGYKKAFPFLWKYVELNCYTMNCVYLEVFSIFQFQFLNFDTLKAQNIRTRLRQKHKAFKISFVVIRGYSWLFRISLVNQIRGYLWLFMVIRTTNEW